MGASKGRPFKQNVNQADPVILPELRRCRGACPVLGVTIESTQHSVNTAIPSIGSTGVRHCHVVDHHHVVNLPGETDCQFGGGAQNVVDCCVWDR